MRRGVVGAIVVGAMVLTGCTAHPVGRSAGGYHLAQIGRFTGQPAQVRVERIRAAPANEVDWSVGSVRPQSDEVPIAWIDGGSPSCGEVDRVQVMETARAVVIGLAATHRGDGSCTLEGHPRALTVRLGRPLGTRALMEGATGANDGLPKVPSPDLLPAPVGTDSAPEDVPVGMADATHRLAPATADEAYVCRTSWPRGRATTTARSISDRVLVRRLAAALDHGATDLRTSDGDGSRCDRHSGTWDSVYLLGPGLRVQVRVDDFACTISNGAVSGTPSGSVRRALDALFTRH